MSSSALKSTNDTKQVNTSIQTKSGEESFEFKDLKYLKFEFQETISNDLESVNKTVLNWIQNKL